MRCRVMSSLPHSSAVQVHGIKYAICMPENLQSETSFESFSLFRAARALCAYILRGEREHAILRNKVLR
jgi:hypothetical protein